MLSLIIAIAISAVSYISIQAAWPDHNGWVTAIAVLVFLAIWILINFRINKILTKIFKDVQDKIASSQDRLRREINMFQQRGMGGPKFQSKIEEQLKASIHEAIELMSAAEPLRKWNWLAGKQTDTMKAQLLYQIKEYDQADPLLEKALSFDPMISAMKMARFYKRDMMAKCTKEYKGALRRFKGDKKVIIYALYSWILVKENNIDEAVVVLNEGKTKTDSPVLKENWEHLVNGRIKKFSNAQLGEAWYSLNLEEQKQIRIRQQASGFGGNPRRFR